MAWLAAGTDNNDLCEQLIENGILTNDALRKAFMLTDRGDFVQPNFRAQAYFDRPFKQAYVHISAPHMYATVLEALELSPGMSFLNVGSGSGYLSCLAACVLGECGLSHGIDVNASVVAHSERCCKVWFEGLTRRRAEGEEGIPKVSKEGVSFVHGNCFHLDIASSVTSCRYDRIYVGAGCPEARKEFFFTLLADDGILVASINERNELIQVRRRHRHIFTETVISNVIFAPLIEPAEELDMSEQRPLTFPMLQMRRQRSGTMSSVTTNASNSVVESARRRGGSIGSATEGSNSTHEESALLSSLSSSPPSNTISLSTSPLSSLLTEAHLNSLMRSTNIPNTHLGFSMSMLSAPAPQPRPSSATAFVGPYAAASATPDTARSRTSSAASASASNAGATPPAVQADGNGNGGDTARSTSFETPRTASNLESARSNGSNTSRSSVVPIRLPPVLWAPIASRHAQFPATFKRAVMLLLMASRRPVSLVTVENENSSSSTAISVRRCMCGAIPLHIWVHVLSFASRDWFVPELSERELMMDELSVEQALRQVAETLLRREQAARRQAERERDMFQSLLRRMRMAASRGRRILFNQTDDDEDEEDDVVHILLHHDEDDEDEHEHEPEEHAEEEEEEEDEDENEADDAEEQPETETDSDNDGPDETVHDWNDDDDELPELIRIDVGAESGGMTVSSNEQVNEHSKGHSNGHSEGNGKGHSSGRSSNGRTNINTAVTDGADEDDVDSSPARKNPRCTTSPANRWSSSSSSQNFDTDMVVVDMEDSNSVGVVQMEVTHPAGESNEEDDANEDGSNPTSMNL